MPQDNTGCGGRGATFPKRPELLKLSRERAFVHLLIFLRGTDERVKEWTQG